MKTKRSTKGHVAKQPVRTSNHSKRNHTRVMMRKTRLRFGRWNTQTSCPQTEEVRLPKMTM